MDNRVLILNLDFTLKFPIYKLLPLLLQVHLIACPLSSYFHHHRFFTSFTYCIRRHQHNAGWNHPTNQHEQDKTNLSPGLCFQACALASARLAMSTQPQPWIFDHLEEHDRSHAFRNHLPCMHQMKQSITGDRMVKLGMTSMRKNQTANLMNNKAKLTRMTHLCHLSHL